MSEARREHAEMGDRCLVITDNHFFLLWSPLSFQKLTFHIGSTWPSYGKNDCKVRGYRRKLTRRQSLCLPKKTPQNVGSQKSLPIIYCDRFPAIIVTRISSISIPSRGLDWKHNQRIQSPAAKLAGGLNIKAEGWQLWSICRKKKNHLIEARWNLGPKSVLRAAQKS